ncbi:MAG TPA: hypothetical protein VGI32_09415 [Steroidobacteraceae bacterium]|jgi:hypothetical protein
MLDQSQFDEMWLFAVDVGNGLTAADCAAISRFLRQGRGLLVTQDHLPDTQQYVLNVALWLAGSIP